MSEIIYWVLAVEIHEGKLEQFKAISARLIDSTRNEPGALNYEWTLSEDNKFCHIYERYVNSAAIKNHIERNGEGVGQLFQVVTPVKFFVYGLPDKELQAGLADLNPVYMKALGGFSR